MPICHNTNNTFVQPRSCICSTKVAREKTTRGRESAPKLVVHPGALVTYFSLYVSAAWLGAHFLDAWISGYPVFSVFLG